MVTASFKGIPLPPSANKIWRVGRNKVYRADDYVKWKSEAGWLLKAARQPPIRGPYSLTVRVQDGVTRLDIGNIEKPLSDLLQDVGVIENDKLCRRLTMEWAPDAWLVEMDVEAVG